MPYLGLEFSMAQTGRLFSRDGYLHQSPQQIRSLFETARRVSHHGLISRPGADGWNPPPSTSVTFAMVTTEFAEASQVVKIISGEIEPP